MNKGSIKFKSGAGHRQCGGFTLVELMVASALSLTVILGTLTLFANSQNSYRTQNLNRHIQENGRFALQIVGEDLRMVKYLGMNIQPTAIDDSGSDVSTLNHCGVAGWAIDVSQPLLASNNSNPYAGSCIDNDNYVAGTDVLVLRHVDSEPIPTSAIKQDDLYLYTSLYNGKFFKADADNAIDSETTNAILEVPASTYRVSSNVYYVRPCSDMSAGVATKCDAGDDDIPTLVRQTLTGTEPLVENVESFQVLFGFDTDSDFSVDRYVNADNVTDWDDVISVRMFVLIRSPEQVTGYSDSTTYPVGDSNVTPGGDDKKFYRKLFSKTLFLRNPSLDTTPV